MSHWGVPGPGGSFGKCAVCGEDFAGGVLRNFAGMDSGITSFDVGFVAQTLYAHDPKCVDAVKQAFTSDEPETVRDGLPDGPLKECLAKAIEGRSINGETEGKGNG